MVIILCNTSWHPPFYAIKELQSLFTNVEHGEIQDMDFLILKTMEDQNSEILAHENMKPSKLM